MVMLDAFHQCMMSNGVHTVCYTESIQFSSPRLINVVMSAKAFQDHDTVISVIDAIVAEKEMSSGVAGMRTKMCY